MNEEVVGKFKGVSAVIPTAVKMLTPSVQGTIGKEVTVKAQVEVPAGQSKAGIPVTFNIVNGTVNQLNEKIEVVAYTNEEGIASHSYTRYYKHNDSVTAYATNKASVFAKGTVYWAESLTITEVTQGNVLSNGAKKVYKVTSPEYKNATVNIAFAENVNVAPDKLVRDVTVTDVGTDSGKYPYQVTTGGTQTVQVKLNDKGEATFTLTGSSNTVTPIVFIDGHFDTYNVWKNGNGKLEEQELQAKAPSVKFDLSHTLGLTVAPQGQQNAAAITTKGDGGREYLVTLTDKNGKVAPDNTELKVVFPKGSISKDKSVYITVKGTDGKEAAPQLVTEDTVYTTYVDGTKGQVTFKLTGHKDAYAAPTVFVDNGSDVNKLDKTDLQSASETSYFVDAVVNSSKLTVLDSEGDEVKTVASSAAAFFEYKSVDQNGFDYYDANGIYEVSYQVSPQFADVTVSGNGLAATTVKKGTTATVKITSTNGKASLRVSSVDTAIESNVTVSASSSQITLEDKPATVVFTKYASSAVSDVATNVNTTTDELTIKGKLYSYKDAFYKYQGSTITKEKFENYIAGNTAVVSVTADDNGKLTFNVLSVAAPEGSKEGLKAAITAAQTLYDNAVEGSLEGQYTVGSKATFKGVIDAAANILDDSTKTPAEIAAANKALADAVKAFEAGKVGNQKVALTTKLADAKTLATTVKAFGTGTFASDAKANEVQAATLTALTAAIATTEVLLADAGAVSADFAAQLTALTTAITNINTDLSAYNNAKTALQTAITIAERAHTNAKSGAGNGQYSANDKAVLLNAITVAKTVASGTATTVTNLTAALNPLTTAKSTFDGKAHAHTVAISGISTSVVLTFTTAVSGVAGTAGDVIADTTAVALAAGTTATATAIATDDDEITISVTTPLIDQTVVVPVKVNNVDVKLTLTFDGSAWKVTKQDPANFVVVTP